MRPNYAQDAPPTVITVGGSDYPVKWDYRVWLEILSKLRQLNIHPKDEAARQKLTEDLLDVQTLAFGGVLTDESPDDALRAILDFSKGYPSSLGSGSSGGDSGEPLISLEHDLNSLVLAIRAQYGVDLSYRRTEPFHWWEFLLLVQNLSGHHHVLDLVEVRAYTGKDRAMLRRKYAAALPVELSAEEQEEWEAFSSQFE